MHEEMASILTGWFAEQEFRRELSKDQFLSSDTLTIVRPTVLSVHDLEILVHHTSHTAVTTFLRSHIEKDPVNKRPFIWTLAELINGKPKEPCAALERALEQGFDQSTLALFGVPISSDLQQ